MSSGRITCAFLGLIMGISLSQAADDEGVEAKVAFDRLKKLEGEWKLIGGDEHHGDKNQMKVIYKVTAAGSTLMETQHPGAKHEMVTMYHLDGKDLKVTHYCAAGNQPRMKLDRKGSTSDLYTFIFDGGSNLNPDKDMHIHGLRIKFLESGQIESEWESFVDGKKADTTKFLMAKP